MNCRCLIAEVHAKVDHLPATAHVFGQFSKGRKLHGRFGPRRISQRLADIAQLIIDLMDQLVHRLGLAIPCAH